jgi:hypothetical protein
MQWKGNGNLALRLDKYGDYCCISLNVGRVTVLWAPGGPKVGKTRKPFRLYSAHQAILRRKGSKKVTGHELASRIVAAGVPWDVAKQVVDEALEYTGWPALDGSIKGEPCST